AAIAISVSLISQDLDSGAVVSIFSKPVSRLAYALGKLIAAILALLVIILILGIGTQLVVLVNGGGHEGSVLQTFLLIGANQLTQMLLILILTSVMNNVGAAIIGIAIVQLGKVAGLFHLLADQAVQRGVPGADNFDL